MANAIINTFITVMFSLFVILLSLSLFARMHQWTTKRKVSVVLISLLLTVLILCIIARFTESQSVLVVAMFIIPIFITRVVISSIARNVENNLDTTAGKLNKD